MDFIYQQKRYNCIKTISNSEVIFKENKLVFNKKIYIKYNKKLYDDISNKEKISFILHLSKTDEYFQILGDVISISTDDKNSNMELNLYTYNLCKLELDEIREFKLDFLLKNKSQK